MCEAFFGRNMRQRAQAEMKTNYELFGSDCRFRGSDRAVLYRGTFLCAFETLQNCKRFMNSQRIFVVFRKNACGWRVEGPNYKSERSPAMHCRLQTTQ